MGQRRSPVVVRACRWGSTSARARMGADGWSATVRFEGVAPDRTAPEAFVAAARALALEGGRTVATPLPVGRGARRRGAAFEATNLAMYPRLRPTRLLAPPRRARPPARGRRVAAFFSGGVDSVHLVLEHHDLVDDLLFVRGFDVPHDDGARAGEVLAAVASLAGELGKPLLVASTDVRAASDRLAGWSWASYGAMVATTILMAGTHRLVLAAASVADRHLPPAVAAARRAPMGNDAAQMRLVGTAATRVEKVAAVVGAGLAADTLRVCWQNEPGTLNCGRCDKCTRTMAAFAAVGGLDRTRAFPVGLDLDAVAALDAGSLAQRAFLAESLAAARAGGAAELAAALQAALGGGGAGHPPGTSCSPDPPVPATPR